MGPGLPHHCPQSRLVEHHLKGRVCWWPVSPPEILGSSPSLHLPFRPPLESETKILVEWNPEYIESVLSWARENEWSVQLISLSNPLRRVRCNTPFLPGKFTKRECAYVERVFSYWR
jgi:hypothetical protein